MTARQRAAAWCIGLVVFIALVFILRDVLLPFVIGMAIAYFLDPACDKLEALGCSRMIATTLIMAGFFVLMVGAVVLLAPLLSTQLLAFIEKLPSYAATLRDYAWQLASFVESRIAAEDMQKLQNILDGVSDRALGFLSVLAKGVFSGFGSLFTLLSLALITPIVTFYMLRDWDRITAKIDSWLPRGNADVIREQVRLIDQTLAGFARGQALVCVLLGVFYAAGLSAVGLEFGLIVGFVTGLISFVPYFGMLVGFVTGVGIAISQFGEIIPVALVALVFGIGQVLEGNFLTPRLVGDRVGLHAVWIIFALLAGGTLFGFLGILLAVPVMAVIGVLARFLLGRYLVSPLYLGDGTPPGDATEEK
jgi:predicted PurR-regulated permease PerM